MHVCVFVCICVGRNTMTCVWKSKIICGNWFLLSPVWVPKVELRWAALAASSVTCWAILSASFYLFLSNIKIFLNVNVIGIKPNDYKYQSRQHSISLISVQWSVFAKPSQWPCVYGRCASYHGLYLSFIQICQANKGMYSFSFSPYRSTDRWCNCNPDRLSGFPKILQVAELEISTQAGCPVAHPTRSDYLLMETYAGLFQ